MLITMVIIYIVLGIYISFNDFVRYKDEDWFRILKLLYWFTSFSIVFLMSLSLNTYKEKSEGKCPQLEQVQEPIYRIK